MEDPKDPTPHRKAGEYILPLPKKPEPVKAPTHADAPKKEKVK